MKRNFNLIAIILALALLSLPVLGDMGGMGEDMMRGKQKKCRKKAVKFVALGA